MKRWEVIETVISKTFTKEINIAEIGVYEGKTVKHLISNNLINIKNYELVDPFKTYASYDDSDFDIRADQKRLTLAKNKLENFIQGRANIELIQKFSTEAVKLFPDKYFDVVFIDANHNFEYVCKDIDAWLPKIKKGGILFGHDFDYPGLPGIKDAVESRFNNQYTVSDDYVWWHSVKGEK